MTKQVFKWQEGEIVEVLGLTKEVEAHAVHQDTLEKPLKHPVTGKIHDSKSAYLKDCELTGTRVVGNDWINGSQKLEDCKPKDLITDDKILRAMKKAENIQRDPAKRRQWQATERRKYIAQQQFMRRAAGAR